MKIPFIRLLISVILLGWAFDILFWKASLGSNFPVFILLILVSGAFLFQKSGIVPAKASLYLLIPIVFFSAATIIRAELLSRALGFTAGLLSLCILAETYQGGRWLSYGLADYLVKALDLCVAVAVRSIEYFLSWRKTAKESTTNKVNLPIAPILRGLAIAIPIVGIFLALLTSADIVFYNRVINFFQLFSFDRSVEYGFRLAIILFVAFVLAGIFIHAGTLSGDEKLIGEHAPLIPPMLGFIETSIVLTSVTLLFLAFVITQLQYFFGGNVNIGLTGFTYSEYARRGFSELVIVGFISLLMIMGFSTIAKRETEFQKRVYSWLSIAIVALVIVMLISAYQRLSLAIAWHGYSRLRLYPKVFMIWVGILFVAVVILEWFRRERHFALAFLMASFGFVVTLNLVNVDAEIVRYNVQRAQVGYHFNAQYLASLSWDAMPALVKAYQTDGLEPVTREDIGAAILCMGYEESQLESLNWRSFTFSRWRAEQAYDRVEEALSAFTLNKGRSPMRVRFPSERIFECPIR